MSIRKGTLYVVATPLGNLTDITHRAAETLSQVQWIAAEDTRHSRVLLDHLGVQAPCVAYHEHNEREMLESLLEKLQRGDSIALISDAGTPLISDPGYALVREARAREIRVVPIPGASAVIAALSVSGLPTDRFVFEGFLPARAHARQERLRELAAESRTLVFYESPHRAVAALQDMEQVLGSEREAVIARELTKIHESIVSDTLANIVKRVHDDPNAARGEIVIMVHGAPAAAGRDAQEVERVLAVLCEELPPSRAAAVAARLTGAARNSLYARAMELSRSGASDDES
jgi:16S rRNA (cytidine1402-2'-O)-methyltransferase